MLSEKFINNQLFAVAKHGFYSINHINDCQKRLYFSTKNKYFRNNLNNSHKTKIQSQRFYLFFFSQRQKCEHKTVSSANVKTSFVCVSVPWWSSRQPFVLDAFNYSAKLSFREIENRNFELLYLEINSSWREKHQN